MRTPTRLIPFLLFLPYVAAPAAVIEPQGRDARVVLRGAHIGLSVSNQPVKNNVFWGYNTIRDCVQFGAQHLR